LSAEVGKEYYLLKSRKMALFFNILFTVHLFTIRVNTNFTH